MIVPLFLYSEQTSIYDIQYTVSSGSDGTYPSPLRNQTVSVTGIVTAVNYLNNGFFISQPEGGAWSGIFITDNARRVKLGDKVSLEGDVYEQFGLTSIRNLRRLRVESSGNPLPTPTLITTDELATSEAFEGVLVQLNNVTIVGNSDKRGVLLIDDGSGVCRFADSFFSVAGDQLQMRVGEALTSVVGVVDYRFGEYRLNPRNNFDVNRSTVGVARPSWGRIKSLYR
jgi:predicted extracellular nuclease